MDRENEQIVYEISVVIPKREVVKEGVSHDDAVTFLINEFKKAGLLVDRVVGLAEEFIKVQTFFKPSICLMFF